MKRAEFEHAIRAAGSILGTSQLMVIGSQALHATVTGDLPDAAQRSVEVDIVAFEDPDEQKAIANRDKDREFCQALLTEGIVDKTVLRSRLAAVQSLAPEQLESVRRNIEKW